LSGRRDRHRMVVRFTTTYAISAYHHQRCEFEFRSWWGVLDTALCDRVRQWLAGDFCRVLRFPPLRYNWSIVIRHSPNPMLYFVIIQF